MLVAILRRARSALIVYLHRKVLSVGPDFHVGARSRLWAPNHIVIGRSVYLGKEVHIECDVRLGDYVVVANRVAFLARRDYEFSAVGTPIRFSPVIAPTVTSPASREIEVVVGRDVWIGFGVILLSGIELGAGCIVGAGSVVTKDVPPYSIVAGNPAVVKGWRFNSETDISAHERRMDQGLFRFSERGYAHATVQPGHEG